MCCQAVAEGFESVQRHEEDDGLVGEVVRWLWSGALTASTSADKYLVADRAMSDGDLGEQRSAERARDAWEHGGDVAVLAEEIELFGSAAIQVRITLFEAENGLALLHCAEAHFEEFLLCCVSVAGEFARDLDGCAAGDEFEDTGGDEFVG